MNDNFGTLRALMDIEKDYIRKKKEEDDYINEKFFNQNYIPDEDENGWQWLTTGYNGIKENGLGHQYGK